MLHNGCYFFTVFFLLVLSIHLDMKTASLEFSISKLFTCIRHKLSLQVAAILIGLSTFSSQAQAQCTPAAINWDWQYSVPAFTSPSRFAIGVNSMVMTWGSGVSSVATPANGTFTGIGSGYGSGNNLQFTAGAGTLTFTFDKEVSNLKFSLYDVDKSQTATVSATNASSTAQNITMVTSNIGSSVTVANSGTTSATATGPSGDLATTSTASGVNIDIAGPVKVVTITFTGSADAVWLSDISACVNGDFVNGYDASLAPDPGSHQYTIAANSSNSVYAVDIATGAATKLFTDAALTQINSLGFDAYRQQVYYVNNVPGTTNKTIYRYDIKTCTKITYIADVTAPPYNIKLNSGGLGAGAASFSSGSLFIGVDVNLSTNEDVAIWRIDCDTDRNPLSASRIFAALGFVGANSSGSVYYDWGDFVISNGILYNFNRAQSAAANTNITHYNLDAQEKVAGYTNTSTTQAALDYNGNIYNLSFDISKYDFAGNFSNAHTIAGDGWVGGSTDAAEYFKFPADYSDAPVSYGRPSHRIRACSGNGMVLMGATVDYETNPVPTTAGNIPDGDDNANYANSGTTNDEDAFTSFPVLSVGASSYTLNNIPVTNTTSGNVQFYGWIDFNQDGKFSATEFASAVVSKNATTTSLTWDLSSFTPNTDIKLGKTYARFRIQAAVLVDSAATAVDDRSIGWTLGGEVEDYQLEVKQLTIAGNVFHDVNGLTDNIVNGTGINNPNATKLYVYLTQAGNIVAKDTIKADGSYAFEGIVNQNDSYTIVISTTNSALASPAPSSAALPAGWVATGEAFGTFNSAGTGNETGTPDMVIPVTTTNRSVVQVNFGIEQPPLTSINTLASQLNPGGKQAIIVAPASFLGSDPDAATNAQRHFLTFPANADSINIAGVGYTAVTFPVGGVYTTLTSVVNVDPSAGAITVDIPFSFVDNAGKESLVAGAVRLPLTDLSLSGTVFDDNNAGTINGIPNGTIGANVLYASLVSVATGNVLGSVPVNANGTYTLGTAQGFYMVPTNTATFKVYITDTLGVVGNPPSATTLINAGNTGEGKGVSPTTQVAPTDGIFAVTGIINTNVTDVNFGINQLPFTTTPAPLAPQPNPGFTTQVLVPLNNFAGTDPEDGTAIRYIHITRFPDSVTSIQFKVNNVNSTLYTSANFPAAGVYLPLAVGANATTINIDPINGGITSRIPFTVLDSGTTVFTTLQTTKPAIVFESPDTSVVLVPFTDFTLSGTVFNDYNGMTNNMVDGIGKNLIAGNTLYANLLLGTTVVGVQAVDANGNYTFTTADGLRINTAAGAAGFSVVVTKTPGTISTTLPAANLVLVGAVNTGESLAPTGNDIPLADGRIQVATNTTNITGVNFGIDILPVANNTTVPSQINPGSTTQVTVPASYFSSTDADEPGNADTIRFTAFPTNVTSIVINGIAYKTTASTGFLAFPAAGIEVPRSGLSVTIDPDPLNVGTITASIPFKVTDTAGYESTVAGSVTVPFRDLGISGRVYNDPTGISDSLVNGTPANVIASNTLYAYLINASTGNILAKQAVTATAGANKGTYDFGTSDGIVPNANYKIIVTNVNVTVTGTTTPAPAATLNTQAAYTAEGNTTVGDGTPDGITLVALINEPIDSVNFGIDILPTVTNKTLTAQSNPGGTDTAGIFFTNFTAADADGTVTAIRITAFPTGGTTTSITVNNIVYTSATFPVGGITIFPTDKVGIDPINGAVTAVIPFVSIDNAGKESTAGANLTIPFNELSLTGIVYNDPNGGTVGGVGASQKAVIGANTLYANLVDSTTGLVIAATPITATGTAAQIGTYSFGTNDGLRTNHTFQVVVTNAVGTVGLVAPSTALTNAGNTAEGVGAFSVGDGTPDGTLFVPIGTANVTNVNFGIDQLPTPTNSTVASQVNPGGNIAVTIANANITGTDPESTTPSQIHYTTFPTFTDSVRIGTVGYTAATWPVGGVTVPINTNFQLNPVDGVVTSVISFKVIDAAGLESTNTGTVTVPFAELSISGNVFDDNNGLASSGVIGGTPTNTIGTNVMNVSLVNNTTGKVVGTVPVNNDGTYTMTTANGVQQWAANTYKLVVSNAPGVVGNTPPSVALVNAKNTGEGPTATGDGTVDGSFNIPALSNVNLVNLNFAIDQLPSTTNPAPLAAQVNPGGVNYVNVPLSNFSGTDPEDGSATRFLHFTRFPDSVTAIKFTVNNIVTTYTSATFPANGVYMPRIVGVNATTVDIDPLNGSLTAKIPFKVLDSATTTIAAITSVTPAQFFESLDSGLALVPFTDILLSGTVFDDSTALLDNMVNGTGINNMAGNTFYANLLKNNLVQGFVPVNADGTYTLSTLQGLQVNTPGVSFANGFSVAISKIPPATLGVALPAANQVLVGAAFTGESLSPTGSDGTVDGKIVVPVAVSNITGVNFGVNMIPLNYDTTLPSRVNDPSIPFYVVAKEAFRGNDSDGTVDSIIITSFPTLTTSFKVNGVTYTSATFPAGGVKFKADTPFVVEINPSATGNTTPVFKYKTKDNVGLISVVDKNVLVPFRDLDINGRVYNDHTGITDSLINGTPTGTTGGQLYAYLVNLSTSKTVARKTIPASGYYNFASGDGVTANTNFQVIVSTTVITVPLAGTSTIPAATLAATAVYTAEGNTTIGDGTPDGITNVSVLVDPVDSINFGIDILPLATAHTNASLLNPGDTNSVVIPFSSFTGTDADNGNIIAGVFLPNLPASGTSNIDRLVINGVVYTSATFPVSGITLHDTDVIRIDPLNNPVATSYASPSTTINAVLPFKVVDSAGFPSTLSANLTQPFTDLYLKGVVFNDPNGGTVNGTAKNVIGSNTMYVSLVDSTTGLVLASRAVGSQTTVGAYVFGTGSGVKANTTFNVVVSNAIGTIGQVPPPVALINAENTGETINGLNTIGDLDSNGVATIAVGVANPPSDIDFGIDILPVPTTKILTTRPNPGGGNLISVANTDFLATDADGTVAQYHIISFPSYIDSFIVGTGVTAVTYTPANFPINGIYISTTTSLKIDPIAGAILSDPISIPFKPVDNAGHESNTSATIDLYLTDLTLSGTVYDDNNGTTDNLVNGVAGNPIGVNNLYAQLVDNISGLVLASFPVSADGTYLFGGLDGINQNTTYKVFIRDTLGTVGQLPTVNHLVRAVNTADALVNAADATADGLYTATVGTVSRPNVNFGIDLLPIPDTTILAAVVNTGGINPQTIAFTNFSGTDPDGSYTTVHFTALPANVYTMKIGATTYGTGATTFPAAGVKVLLTAGAAAKLVQIDPLDGVDSVKIPFTLIDNATKESTDTGFVIQPFIDLTISGRVFNDTNGLANSGIVDGTPINTIQSNTLYANLVNPTTGKVVSSKAVLVDGTYSFSTQDGLAQATNFNVVISNALFAVGTTPSSTLNNGVVNTGEGILPAGDGTPNGITAANFGPSTTSIVNVNFGLDAPPVSTSASYTIAQPVSNSSLSLTSANGMGALQGIDPEQGPLNNGATLTINSISGLLGNQLYYNGVLVTANTVITNYDSTKLSIKFTSATTTTSSFTFTYQDAAGVVSSSPATYTINYPTPLSLNLLDFQASKTTDNRVQLNWQTSAEFNSDYFEVERSANGRDFSKSIARVKAAGNSHELLNYQSYDNEPMNNDNFYRLKMMNADGRYQYSAIRRVVFELAPAEIVVYPTYNTQGILHVQLPAGMEQAKLSLVNIAGQVLRVSIDESKPLNRVLYLNSLPAAEYMLHIEGGTGKRSVFKVVYRP